ncbi:uncharacterized protein LOC141660181 [Apium graveolens]|uniref:uncharacterized protein LOC141660181 n=1 Tax=Apium graveolens TaxID=4045 RepID=UPI003D7A9D18
MGHSPSFIWRSICEAKNLIVDGVRWRIGTGKKINIIGQPWLLNNADPYVSTTSQALEGKTVDYLFEGESKRWNVDIIKSEFNDRDQKCILDTRVPIINSDDMLFWNQEDTGNYSCWLAIKVDTQGRVFADFGTWLEDILQAVNARESAAIISLCWAIWRNRNDIVWNQRFSSVNKTVAAAKQYLTQWSLAQSRSSVVLLQPVHEGDGDVVWANPQQNSVKVSVDAAVFEDKEGSGFGLITRDSKGMLLQAKTGIFAGVVTPVLAEAMAVKEALSWIDRMKWMDVTLVSDCLVVVQAIRSITPMRSQFGNVIEECREYLRRLNKIGLYHVKRSPNRAAHQLARESYNYSGRSFNRDSIPLSVKRCIELDLSN